MCKCSFQRNLSISWVNKGLKILLYACGISQLKLHRSSTLTSSKPPSASVPALVCSAVRYSSSPASTASLAFVSKTAQADLVGRMGRSVSPSLIAPVTSQPSPAAPAAKAASASTWREAINLPRFCCPEICARSTRHAAYPPSKTTPLRRVSAVASRDPCFRARSSGFL